ncbi:MAG: hypothetical protein P4L28_11975 [Paludibacteraceae bacterium]|nr:hypothetical protein [Paludibacteraceae bacterium]
MSRYLPRLSTLLTPSNLPDNLGFFQNLVDTVFDDIYYDNYEVTPDKNGGGKTYNLDIVLSKELGFEIPGTGLSLLINPSSQADTSFNITLAYRLGILRYISNFNLSAFSNASDELVSLFNKITNVQEPTLLEKISEAINTAYDESLNFIVYTEEEAVNFFNDFYQLEDSANALVYSASTTFDDIETALTNAGITIDQLIEDFDIATDYPGGEDTIEDVFARLNVDLDAGALSVSDFVSTLNNDFSLLGTSNEIKYVSEIETTYDTILSGLKNAEISIVDLIKKYVIEDLDSIKDIEEKLISFFVEAKVDTYGNEFYGLFKPTLSVSINDLTLAIAFPRTMLTPVGDTTGTAQSMLRFKVGTLSYSTANGLEFDGENNISFDKSNIGSTGMVISFSNMKLDLSSNSNIAEATAAGYSNDFVGVYVGQAEIDLPEKWFTAISSTSGETLGIYGTDMLLGTGGISGTFGLKAVNTTTKEISSPSGNNEMEFTLGSGFKLGFKNFDITLKQGEFVDTNIAGSLILPFFKDSVDTSKNAKIGFAMSFDKDGDFNITASTNGLTAKIPSVANITFKTLSAGKEDGKFYISTSADLDLRPISSTIFPTPFSMSKLVIWQDGTIELKGLDGGVKLPINITLQIGPAKITVTNIAFSTYEQNHNGSLRKYWCLSFDGGISINPGGVDARGDGIKLYFTVDGGETHFFFRIQSLKLDLIIPGSASKESAAVLISGYLSMKDAASESTTASTTGSTSVGTEYTGGVDITLPKLGMSASAAMRLNPSVPAFLVDVSLSLPMCLPLGGTGLGIYGFRGLLGKNYVASKTAAGIAETEPWYEYYKAKTPPLHKQGINVYKFTQKNGFSLGAGVSLATSFDKGKTFSSKIFFLLSLPDAFLFEGQATILSTRIDLDATNDPPFYAMIAIDSSHVEAALGVNLNLPMSSGDIAKVSGTMEMAFYYKDAGGWYLNVGRDLPESKRVTARLFTLFDVYFYFMISKQGIRAGAGASWDFKRKIGPARVTASAYIDVAGRISFKPVQIGGSVAVGGSAGVSIWKFGFGISVDAGLAAEAPKPFMLSGYIQVSLKLPWPFKKFRFKLDFTWTFNKKIDLSEVSLLEASTVKAVNVMTGEVFKLYAAEIGNLQAGVASPSDIDSYVIPLDSYIDFEFNKGMNVSGSGCLTRFRSIEQGATGCVEYIPPQRGKSTQVQHTYSLEYINIFAKNSSGNWTDYDVYGAIKPKTENYSSDDVTLTTDTSGLTYGFWQSTDPGKYNKLRVFARSPLSFVGKADNVIPEQLGYTSDFLTCAGTELHENIIYFNEAQSIFPQNDKITYQGVIFILRDADGAVTNISGFPYKVYNKVLSTSGTIEIYFPEPCAQNMLYLVCATDSAIITTYKKVLQPKRGFNDVPLYEYEQIEQQTIYGINTSSGQGVALNEGKTDSFVRENMISKITIKAVGTTQNTGFIEDEDTGFMTQENTGDIMLEEADSYQNQIQLMYLRTLSLEDYTYNQTMLDVDYVKASGNALKTGFQSTLQTIWRPDTEYLIRLQTKDYLNAGRKRGGYRRTYDIRFKTAGPVGHFHEFYERDLNGNVVKKTQDDYGQLADANKDQFRLATLKSYIDMNTSYPNADGRLTNAKPLFYVSPELNLYYNYNYVYTMYNDLQDYNGNSVASKLEVVVKSPTEQLSTPGTIVEAPRGIVTWVLAKNNKQTKELNILQNVIRNGQLVGENCTGLETFTDIMVMQKVTFPGGKLDPDKLYTALFNGVYTGSNGISNSIPVHSYQFKTSTYGSFNDQVQSFNIVNEDKTIRQALYSVQQAIDSTYISKAIQILTGNESSDSTLLGQYADKYERLVTGALQLGTMLPASTTDITLVKNTSTNTLVGLIVRNPEPFNDPKISDSILLGSDATPPTGYPYTVTRSINMEYKDHADTNTFIVIHSRDRSMAFITNATMNIETGTDYNIRFKYLKYNVTTSSYEVNGNPEPLTISI